MHSVFVHHVAEDLHSITQAAYYAFTCTLCKHRGHARPQRHPITCPVDNDSEELRAVAGVADATVTASDIATRLWPNCDAKLLLAAATNWLKGTVLKVVN
jgi:hypothetical protein